MLLCSSGTSSSQHSSRISSFMNSAEGVTFCVQAGFVKYRLQWTPQPLAADAPSDLFSEQRALDHVRRLTVSGRLVSHPAIEDAVQYIVNYTEALAAEATSRSDVVVEVGA